MDSQRNGQGSYVRLESNDAIVSRLAAQDEVPWYNKPNLRLLYFLMIPTCIGVEMTSGFDVSMMSGLQAVPSWLEYYNYPHSASLGLMASMYSLGSFAAAPFVPLVADKLGRRRSILLGGVISMVGSILQGTALNLTMFIVARFILGTANVLCIVAASSLIGELSHPKERAVMTSIFNISYSIGGVAAAAVTLGTFAMRSNWGWRIPSFLQVVPSLLQVSFIWFLPESPRWLISKGGRNEAYAILVKYHAEGDENSEFVKAEYTQIEETLGTELKIAQLGRTVDFLTPGMRKRVTITAFFALFTQWCGIGLTGLYLSPILDVIGIHDNWTKNIVNLSRHSWSFVNGTFAALIAPRYPRRRVFLLCATSIFLVFSAWTIANAEYSFTGSQTSAHVVLALIFLYSPAYNIGFNALPYTYLVELFPFHVRARGIAFYQCFSRGAAFLSQLMDPIGIDLAGWRWYIVYCVWDAFQIAFIYLMFPETSGCTLEELTFLYEDEQEVLMHSEMEGLHEHDRDETSTYHRR